MMKKLFFIIFFCHSIPLIASNVDSLFNRLDQVMLQSASYTDKKQQKIDTEKKRLKLTHHQKEQYEYNYEIANLYLGFQYDSAYVYSKRSIEIARKIDDKELEQKALILFANILSSSGLFTEAKETLDSIKSVPPSLSFSLHAARERLYANLCDYHNNSELVGKYEKLLQKEYQLAFQSLKPTDPLYYLYAYRDYEQKGEWKEALKMILKFTDLTEEGSQQRAVALSCVANVYDHLGDMEKRKEYLIQSAISDITSATKENRSMLEIAMMLYNEKSIKRAYSYILFALNDANYYNARFRNLQISRSLPLIEKAYQKAALKYRITVWVCMAFIGFLCLILVGIVIKLRTKNRKIGTLQQQLIIQNKNLQHLTDEQKALILLQSNLNKEIEARNKELSTMTNQYKEANHQKDEYLGHFLQMCSDYIIKLNEYRKMINRKLLAGQYQDLVTLTSSPKSILSEKDEFYKQFDYAFLHLYPDFSRKLNELLLPNEGIDWKKGESLTNELRICALIRLGINDSSRIADFLGYTPSTVYTYRTKMRNKAIDRANFEQQILQIS